VLGKDQAAKPMVGFGDSIFSSLVERLPKLALADVHFSVFSGDG